MAALQSIRRVGGGGGGTTYARSAAVRAATRARSAASRSPAGGADSGRLVEQAARILSTPLSAATERWRAAARPAAARRVCWGCCTREAKEAAVHVDIAGAPVGEGCRAAGPSWAAAACLTDPLSTRLLRAVESLTALVCCLPSRPVTEIMWWLAAWVTTPSKALSCRTSSLATPKR